MVLCSGLLAAATPAAAKVETSPLHEYVKARAAASAGEVDRASVGFSAALDADPRNETIATQALAHAVGAGDWPLALRAARSLEQSDALLPDARFLLVADALKSRRWNEAGRQIDAIDQEQLFAFAVPVLRAWLAHGSRKGNPLQFLPEQGAADIASLYAREHRALLSLARGDESAASVFLDGAGPRATRLRIAAAAHLANKGKSDEALALLQGNGAALAAARSLVPGKRLPGAIDTAAAGAAELFVRLAVDLHAQDLTPLALSLARLATYLAPDSSETWMVASELLAQQDRHGEALGLLDNVPGDDPFAEAVNDQRIRLLAESGEGARALAVAERAARSDEASVADLVRYGETLLEQERPADAANAFARAIQLRDANEAAYPEWALWLFRGGAHDEAGDWPEARAALERAYTLAPDQPLVLNYLGYAQLERGMNLAEAERLVREAHRLAPDNAAITDSLGWALFLKGDKQEAIRLLEAAVEGAPADVEINEHLGDAYFSTGRRVEARYAWRAARVQASGEDARRLETKIEKGLEPQLAAR